MDGQVLSGACCAFVHQLGRLDGPQIVGQVRNLQLQTHVPTQLLGFYLGIGVFSQTVPQMCNNSLYQKEANARKDHRSVMGKVSTWTGTPIP